MTCRRVYPNLFEGVSNALLDLPGPGFRSNRVSQFQHVVQSLGNAAMRKRVDPDTQFLHSIPEIVLRAIGDDEVRFVLDDLFDVGIQQAADSRLVLRAWRELIVVADSDDAISKAERIEHLSGAGHNRNDPLWNSWRRSRRFRRSAGSQCQQGDAEHRDQGAIHGAYDSMAIEGSRCNRLHRRRYWITFHAP